MNPRKTAVRAWVVVPAWTAAGCLVVAASAPGGAFAGAPAGLAPAESFVGMEGAPLPAEGASTPVSDAGFHYHFFKDRIPLPIDGARIAVLQRGVEGKGDAVAMDQALAASLAAAGFDPAAAEAHPVRGWFLVPVPGGVARDAAGIEALVAALAADPAVGFVSPVFVDLMGGPLIITPDLFVAFEPEVAQRDAAALVAATGVGAIVEHGYEVLPGVLRVRATGRNGFEVLAAANALAVQPQVLYAEPDAIFTGRNGYIPNDTSFGTLWGLHNTGQSGGVVDRDMDAPEAWDITIGVSSIVVIVIDTGVQQNHPDINQRAGNDTTSDASTTGGPVNACDNHGTPVAGCVSAIINNNLGVVGVAPGCRSASVRTFISNQPCTGGWTSQASWTVNALNWGQSIGARVSNNSNGYGFTSATIATAYTNTRNAGMVHFASAGNDSTASLNYPASLGTVNAVAALTRTGTRAGFSNWGTGLAYSAPGAAILSTDRTGAAGYAGGDYATVDGTSFSSPYAAGVAALVLSENSALTAAQVETRLNNGCVDLGAAGYDTNFGWGFINARNSLPAGPSNDNCAAAITVFANNVYNGTLRYSTNDGTATCGSSTQNPDVWYRFTAPVDGCGRLLRVSTCGTHDIGGTDAGIDTVLALFSACGGTQLACNDDTSICGALDQGTVRDSFVSTLMTPGQSVLIRVSRFGSTIGGLTGPFVLRVDYAPPHDDCSAATIVGLGSTPFCTLGATTDGPTEAACNFFSQPQTFNDVWYRFTATCNAPVRVSVCGATYDTKLAVYGSACPVGSGSVIACNDDSCGLGSQVTFDATAGTQYRIRLGSFNSTIRGTGTMVIRVAGDWNGDGLVNSGDITAYLTAWLDSINNFNRNADFNNDNVVNSGDITAFLTAWLAAINNC